MAKVAQPTTPTPDLAEWFQSIGVRRDDGRIAVPVLDRCTTCRSAAGCGSCTGCKSGQVCHRLPLCPKCGAVQEIAIDRLLRHPLHRQLYGETPEQEVFATSNGALFLQSVAALGIIEPILGLEAEDEDETGAEPGDVLVLSGWRRVLAARASTFPTVPVRLANPTALPRRGDVDLVIVSANLQRQKTIEEIRAEVEVWKRALTQASLRQPKQWELRVIVAKAMGVSVRTVEQAESTAAKHRVSAAAKKLGLPQRNEITKETISGAPTFSELTALAPRQARHEMLGVSAKNQALGDEGRTPSPHQGGRPNLGTLRAGSLDSALGADTSMIARLRHEQQPGDLRGSDIISALAEGNEPLLSEERDEIIHESIGRAAQTAAGTFILDVQDVPPFWPEDPEGADATAEPEESVDGMIAALTSSSPSAVDNAPLAPVPSTSSTRSSAGAPVQVHNLTVHYGPPEALPFTDLPAADLIIAAPSWFEPMVRPLMTPSHVPFTRDWQDRLHRCLRAWRSAIRPGGRLLLIAPISTPLHPGLPLLYTAIEALRSTDWAIGGSLVLHDPNLHGPMYAAAHSDQVLPPKGPARMIITAAPVLSEAAGDTEERWRQSWAASLPGQQPREVAAVEEAALNHLWKYAGPGRRSRWLPEFHPGLLYHLIRIFSRPDATVFLPELGGTNMVRGCLRTGRQIVALAELHDQVTEVVERIRRDVETMPTTNRDPGFLIDTLTTLTDDEDLDENDE